MTLMFSFEHISTTPSSTLLNPCLTNISILHPLKTPGNGDIGQKWVKGFIVTLKGKSLLGFLF